MQRASRQGVLLASGREFCAEDADCPKIRIPFTATKAQLEEGLRRLVEAWRSFDGTRVAPQVI